jgi:hypothetical protein
MWGHGLVDLYKDVENVKMRWEFNLHSIHTQLIVERIKSEDLYVLYSFDRGPEYTAVTLLNLASRFYY